MNHRIEMKEQYSLLNHKHPSKRYILLNFYVLIILNTMDKKQARELKNKHKAITGIADNIFEMWHTFDISKEMIILERQNTALQEGVKQYGGHTHKKLVSSAVVEPLALYPPRHSILRM